MPYMLLLREKVVLDGGVLEIELHDDLRYRLSLGGVVYENGVRRLRGRARPYQFRSVEQLRYDFERDLESAGGRLGEAD